MSNLRFPDSLAGLQINVQRDADYDVKVQQTQSRKELRYTYETYPLTRYKVGFEVLRSDSSLSTRARELQQALTHIARHYGQLDSFLLIDPADSSVTDHGFAVGDGVTTAFQLQRTLQGDVIDAYGEWPASSKPRTNLCVRSQEFDNAAWSKSAATVLPNVAIAPDGTVTADALFDDATSASHFAIAASNDIGGQTRTYSCFVKPGSLSKVRIGVNTFPVAADFDLAAGTVISQNGISAAITKGSSGWCRCSFTYLANGTGAGMNVMTLNAAGSTTYVGGGGSLYVWGGQMEIASAATQYIPTTSAAVTVNPSYWPGYADGYEPIFDINYFASPFAIYADGDWRLRRQLYPWQRTNLLLWSEQVDNAAWVKSGATVTANAATAPDGTASADKLVESAANVDHYASQTPTLTAGLRYVKSVYAKAAGRNFIMLQMKTLDGTFRNATFDLINGTAVNNGGSADALGIQPMGSGWFRCWIVVDARTGVNANNEAIFLSNTSGFGSPYLGDGASGAYLWGAQTEQVPAGATAPTEYIQTTTVTVSRTDYTLSATASFTPVAVPAAGTFYSWDGSFFRRVRFAQQAISVEQMVQALWSAKSLDLVTAK